MNRYTWIRTATVVAAALAIAGSVAEAQRGGRGGGRFPRGVDLSALMDPEGFYTPPDFHGNPPYDGRFTFARIKYRGYDHWAGREGPGWAHDYPDADEHLMAILRDVSTVRPFLFEDKIHGGAIVALDDPLLFKYPVAYLSEPGGWHPDDKDLVALSAYLRKGGVIIYDDFNSYDFQNVIGITRKMFPTLQFQRLKGTEPIFDSFFKIDVKKIEQQCMANRRSCYRGIPQFWALYQDNDPKKHLLMLANVDADVGEFWQWSGTGFSPVDVSNEAYKLGVNWIVYMLTHP